ncbi:MAG: MotA/TolQ/ExbB proton channel family protein [Lentisphaeria bacterium]
MRNTFFNKFEGSIAGIIVTMLLSSTLRAAEEEAAAASGGDSRIDTLADILQAGGVPLYFIIILSIATLFLVLFFLFTFRASVLAPRKFIQEADEAARDGDVEAVRSACQSDNSAASSIINSATEHIETTGHVDYFTVRDAVEDEGSRQANTLWQRLQYLMDVAVVAPMVGLLGTVLGMLDSFAGMETELGAVKPVTVSQGVAKALITTAAGLSVGIAAMILYALFRGRLNKLITHLEITCNGILRRMVENVKKRQESES